MNWHIVICISKQWVDKMHLQPFPWFLLTWLHKFSFTISWIMKESYEPLHSSHAHTLAFHAHFLASHTCILYKELLFVWKSKFIKRPKLTQFRAHNSIALTGQYSTHFISKPKQGDNEISVYFAFEIGFFGIINAIYI